MVATLAYWLSSFVFPTCESHEIRAKTFPMACQLARGTRTTIGVACLSALYSHLDYLIDPKGPLQHKKGGLQVHYLSGWLSTYCLVTYVEQSEVEYHFPLLCKIAGATPLEFSLKEANELFFNRYEAIEMGVAEAVSGFI